jgi:tetratricopeptide (TPR) repeat protein
MSKKHKKPLAPGRAKRTQTPPAVILNSPRTHLERANRAIGKLLATHQFDSLEDVNAFLQKTIASGDLKRIIQEQPSDPREQAQELAYRAMEARTPKEARRLAEQALKLDADCVDALVLLAQAQQLSPQEYIERMRAAVEAGARSLGSDFFEQNKGHFWGIVQTRPYMRARWELALALASSQQFPQAIRELEALIELNPNDNQGARDYLLSLYLLTADLPGADRLFKQYPNDTMANFAWAKLLRHLIAQNAAGARAALRAATKTNPHVLAYLSGRKRMPRESPDYYSPGDESEAVNCMMILGPAWLAHPQAWFWLLEKADKLL